jgi:UDP-N-acetyl-D-mannosaminuronate dehydrogenase
VRNKDKVVVVGLGEIGRPLFELVSRHCDSIGVDINLVDYSGSFDILHICYPFEIDDFVAETARYIGLFRPTLTIINSTVAIGTTRQIAERTDSAVVSSPVRGKHACMIEELIRYTKFVGAIDRAAGEKAAAHFFTLGIKTKLISSPEATELAKLTETTYFGLMIAWAQQVERYCDQLGENYDDVAAFYEEIQFFPPVKYSPGVIGGHCVMENIKILKKFAPSEVLAAIEDSNRRKVERESRSKTKVAALA